MQNSSASDPNEWNQLPLVLNSAECEIVNTHEEHLLPLLNGFAITPFCDEFLLRGASPGWQNS